MPSSKLLDLKTEAFSDFGQILSTTAKPAGATNEEYDYWGRVSTTQLSSTASSGLLLCKVRKPIVRSFERHKNTPEILVALEGDTALCLAKAAEKPAEIRWFKVQEGDAVALHPGTWHWIPFPMGGHDCRFLVIFALGTEENDLFYTDLESPVFIDF